MISILHATSRLQAVGGGCRKALLERLEGVLQGSVPSGRGGLGERVPGDGKRWVEIQSLRGLLGSLKTQEFRLLFEVDFFTDLYSFWDPFWGHFVPILAVETSTKTLRISRSFPGVVRAVPGALQARKV